MFSGNEATSSSGGIHNNNNNNSPTIYNSVFYGNGSDIVNSASASTTGGSNFSEHYAETGFTALTADPFSDSANPIGADGIWFTTDDGLQPSSATSPITDEGDATKLPLDTLDLDGDGDTTKAIPVDITGRTRIAGTALDAGAYEHDSAVLSVKDIDSSKLDIYSTGHKTLVIHGVFNAKTTANVYSLQGKLVASKTFEKFSTSSSLDVSTLSTGIYIVKMHNANHQVQTKKLFIQ
ncbi:T9SS type A sorting domain-containing protein [bacterium]|nr:T9SS type A sorting domain-containing protein [bacterium]